VATTLGSLTTISRAGKRPAFGAIFVLNNASYMLHEILVSPANVGMLDLLSRGTQDLLNSNFRTAKAGYFDSNFYPLMQTLTDEPGAKAKVATKEKFTRFFEVLEEVRERHRVARVLEGNEEGREVLREEVVKLIVPSLRQFTANKGKEKEFGKSTCFFLVVGYSIRYLLGEPYPQKCTFACVYYLQTG
jgi:exocyst complex protein 7